MNLGMAKFKLAVAEKGGPELADWFRNHSWKESIGKGFASTADDALRFAWWFVSKYTSYHLFRTTRPGGAPAMKNVHEFISEKASPTPSTKHVQELVAERARSRP